MLRHRLATAAVTMFPAKRRVCWLMDNIHTHECAKFRPRIALFCGFCCFTAVVRRFGCSLQVLPGRPMLRHALFLGLITRTEHRVQELRFSHAFVLKSFIPFIQEGDH
jgi:hypothetical protein